MATQKIYISGAISGLPRLEVIEKFEKAERYLKSQGFHVINPVKLDHTENELKYWQIYMKTDLKAMLHIDCNIIYMLPCWEDSAGAKIELQLALALGYDIIWA